jgi:hypothetical protein
MSTELEDLQRWYESQCDGDWEHRYGVAIGTLDNPGWSVKIDLAETELEGRPFTEIDDRAPDRSWMSCKVENGKFLGYGGAPMLGRVIRSFLDWASQSSPPAV